MSETPDFARDLRDALMEIKSGAPCDNALDLWPMSTVSCPLWTRQSENTLVSDCGRYAIAEADDSHLCTVTFDGSVLAQVDFLDKAEAVARRPSPQSASRPPPPCETTVGAKAPTLPLLSFFLANLLVLGDR